MAKHGNQAASSKCGTADCLEAQAAAMAELADGVIVGSAVVRLFERYGRAAAVHVGEYVRSMKDAVRK